MLSFEKLYIKTFKTHIKKKLFIKTVGTVHKRSKALYHTAVDYKNKKLVYRTYNNQKVTVKNKRNLILNFISYSYKSF